MNKTLNKYITALAYVDKTLLVLSDASSGVSFGLFTTIIGTPVGIANASISLVYLTSNGISAIIKPLSIIFRNCISQSTFPNIWKKPNICFIRKRGDKQGD